MRNVSKTELSPDNGCVIDLKWKLGPLSYHASAAGKAKPEPSTEHGFTAFICWTFQPEHTALKIKQRTGVAEYLRTQALARIFLDNIDNIQSSWVTQGPGIGQIALQYGANDFGSVMLARTRRSSSTCT